MSGRGAEVSLSEALERERAGDWAGAATLFSGVFDSAARQRDLELLVEALRGQARLSYPVELLEAAEELALLGREIAERAGLEQAAARSINVQAVLRYRRQDWAGAERLYVEALERGLDAGDDQLVGSACMNLGVVANILGELREARVRYLEGIGSVVRSGNKANEAMLYNNLGMVCADLQEWLESDLYFSRGIEIAERLRLVPLLAQLLVNRAEPLIHLDETEAARGSLQRGEELVRRTGNVAGQADAARFRGLLALRSADTAAAEEHFARSLEIARSGGRRLEEAEALRELAELSRRLGAHDDAVRLARVSLDLFRSLGARRDAERVESLLFEWTGEMVRPHPA
jgi:tetratricopeptide (TPR) repeat protein